MKTEITAAIVDFDGVIADTETARFAKLQEILKRHGVVISNDFFLSTVGRPAKAVFSEFNGSISPREIKIALQEYHTEFKSKLLRFAKPIEPTVEFFKSYAGGKRLAIASMSTGAAIEMILENFGIRSKFEMILSRDDVSHLKPHPEIYLKTARRMSVRPQECVVIEDSLPGVQAAQAAKMSCYIFLNGVNRRSDFLGIRAAGYLETKGDFDRLFAG